MSKYQLKQKVKEKISPNLKKRIIKIKITKE